MSLPPPRIIEPVALGDRVVWVSGKLRDETVTIMQGSTAIGVTGGTDPIVAVPVSPVSGPVRASARRQLLPPRLSQQVTPVQDPGGAGDFPRAAMRDVDYGQATLPTHPTPDGTEGGFSVPLRGRVWLPAGSNGQVPGNLGRRPLVLIAHGYWADPEEDKSSLQGYGWLGEQLARFGMVACSMDLSAVNLQTSIALPQQWTRGEAILFMIDRLLADGTNGQFIDRRRIGLVGHSMGGEGVVMAQLLNRNVRRPRYGIHAVASLAPTNYRREEAVQTAYLQLHGSQDYLLVSRPEVNGPQPRYGGFRLYDRAWRERSFGWLAGARHEAWNSVWLDSWNSIEPPPDPQLPPLPAERQQQIGRAFLTAFFLDTLAGRPVYRGYLSGPSMPQAVGDAVVHRQHQSPSAAIIDDFGDANPQLRLPVEDPPDKTINRRGGLVRASGQGLAHWEEVDHSTLTYSVHKTRGLDLGWRGGNVIYESRFVPLEVAPTDVISLRVAQDYRETASGAPDETWNRVGDDHDLLVELSDGIERAEVRMGAVDPVPYPLPGATVYSVFRTVRLPIDAFLAVNSRLNFTALREIRLKTTQRTTGRVLVDDIEFETTIYTAPSTLSMLRVHELATGYGPADDYLDTEVVVHLTDRPGESFGFPLRRGDSLPVARAMLTSLRSALAGGRSVRLGYRWAGPSIRLIERVIPQ